STRGRRPPGSGPRPPTGPASAPRRRSSRCPWAPTAPTSRTGRRRPPRRTRPSPPGWSRARSPSRCRPSTLPAPTAATRPGPAAGRRSGRGSARDGATRPRRRGRRRPPGRAARRGRGLSSPPSRAASLAAWAPVQPPRRLAALHARLDRGAAAGAGPARGAVDVVRQAAALDTGAQHAAGDDGQLEQAPVGERGDPGERVLAETPQRVGADDVADPGDHALVEQELGHGPVDGPGTAQVGGR